ncbi:hypothetical protein [Spirillospora sp. CA-294931]|uniref:hypothetical protein n=1 Tax=Spirillospora sp. CA-294931 TaxID=3240042 RepID=UPI003D912FEF
MAEPITAKRLADLTALVDTVIQAYGSDWQIHTVDPIDGGDWDEVSVRTEDSTPTHFTELFRASQTGHGLALARFLHESVRALPELLAEMRRLRGELAADRAVGHGAKHWHDSYQQHAGAVDAFFAELLDLLPGATETGADAYDQIPRAIEKLRADRDEVERVRAERDEARAVMREGVANMRAQLATARAERDKARAEVAAFCPPGRLAPGEHPALCPTCSQHHCVPGLPGCTPCVAAKMKLLRTELAEYRAANMHMQQLIVKRAEERPS